MRHDWRFLLPRADDGIFDHLLLIGGCSELGADVADLGLARRVTPRLADARSGQTLRRLY